MKVRLKPQKEMHISNRNCEVIDGKDQTYDVYPPITKSRLGFLYSNKHAEA